MHAATTGSVKASAHLVELNWPLCGSSCCFAFVKLSTEVRLLEYYKSTAALVWGTSGAP
jgi:hypothetical protein